MPPKSDPRKKNLTEGEYGELLDTERRRDKAKTATRENTYGSAEYWDHAKYDVEARLKISDNIEWIGNQRKHHGAGDVLKQAEAEYRQQRAELEEQHVSMERRKQRHRKRDSVLKSLKTESAAAGHAAFMELLATVLVQNTSRPGQKALIRDLKQAYGYQKLQFTEDVWNILSGDWIDRSVAIAAHITPLSLGQKTMAYIFGPDAQEEMNTARNALWLPSSFEKQFGKHLVVIVPDGPLINRQWKVVVLEKGLRDVIAFEKTTFGDIDGKRLIFRTNAQPQARYLYFHYLCAMIKQSRQPRKEAGQDVTMSELSRAWELRGSYLRENVINGFIEYLGHEISDEIQRMQSHSSKKASPNDSEECAEALEDMDLKSDDENDYENDDESESNE